ncbi:hemerythrin domain-containing protein [Sphingomonas sp. CROZ-RG-20F-R02-07]|uniref:hemerythrin domain-containing protein n=1 Tax=Sphingomonas sp. CROZ-RG-20F-R02-07 TaxID=2914832 RepID=UPI001F57D467|nr:hemerythrin domain-containing protein [Sphingomonas sp. CROZ-RG-20F-R02-07]
MDICNLILEDHAEQRKLFAIIEEIGTDDAEALGSVWNRLHGLLDTHAEAEERYFYPTVVRRGEGAGDADDMHEEVEDAIDDHNEIRDAAAAVAKEQVGTKAWFDAVDKANLVNSKHMAEEERQGMTDYRRHTSAEERHAAAIKFAAFDAKYLTGVKAVDKDPDAYIDEQKG